MNLLSCRVFEFDRKSNTIINQLCMLALSVQSIILVKSSSILIKIFEGNICIIAYVL